MTDTTPTPETARRDRYATAIRDRVRIRLGATVLRLAQQGRPLVMTFGEAETAADAAMAVADAELRLCAAETPPITVQELARALDNSTPYPVELDSALCRAMAERLLEMTSIHKRPEHDVWQPDEEPPTDQPDPIDPATLQDRLRCPRCDEDITDYAEDDHVHRTGDDRPYCSGECVIAAGRART